MKYECYNALLFAPLVDVLPHFSLSRGHAQLINSPFRVQTSGYTNRNFILDRVRKVINGIPSYTLRIFKW